VIGVWHFDLLCKRWRIEYDSCPASGAHERYNCLVPLPLARSSIMRLACAVPSPWAERLRAPFTAPPHFLQPMPRLVQPWHHCFAPRQTSLVAYGKRLHWTFETWVSPFAKSKHSRQGESSKRNSPSGRHKRQKFRAQQMICRNRQTSFRHHFRVPSPSARFDFALALQSSHASRTFSNRRQHRLHSNELRSLPASRFSAASDPKHPDPVLGAPAAYCFSWIVEFVTAMGVSSWFEICGSVGYQEPPMLFVMVDRSIVILPV